MQGSPRGGVSYGDELQKGQKLRSTQGWQGDPRTGNSGNLLYPLGLIGLGGQKGRGGVTRARKPRLPSRSSGCRDRSCPEGAETTEEMQPLLETQPKTENVGDKYPGFFQTPASQTPATVFYWSTGQHLTRSQVAN